MTSIHTNASAMEALASLRLLSARSTTEHAAVATGLRIGEAADGVSYWSIATGMRSDMKSLAAVQDALGLGAAKADVAYAAMDQVSGVLTEIQSRLIAAMEPGVDREAIQTEIRQLALQTRQAADAASFAGTNWLTTDIEDLWEAPLEARSTSLLSSYARDAQGLLSLGTTIVDLKELSLFNADGGGILDADPRSPKSIGGVRWYDPVDGTAQRDNWERGSNPLRSFLFTAPLDFSTGGTLVFDVTVDADDPARVGPPHHPGATASVTIDRAEVEAALGGSSLVADHRDMQQVLSRVLSGTGVYATLFSDWANPGQVVPDMFGIGTTRSSGLDGAHVGIDLVSTTVGGWGGLSNVDVFGSRGHSIDLSFSPFKVYKDVEIAFDFGFNGNRHAYVMDRAFVDGVLGRDDGKVQTAAEMTALLEALVGQPGLVVDEGAGGVTLHTDATDRLSGSRSHIGFYDIAVNIEPIPQYGVLDIDIVRNPDLVSIYRDAVTTMIDRVNHGAAALGALKTRIGLQRDFTETLIASLQRGVGTLVDADMEESSTRLQALDVQRQLAVQALGIANARPQAVLSLFG
jgi:flagellin